MSILFDPQLRTWDASMPKGVRDDLIWRFHTYRVALFMLHLAREDVGLVRSLPSAASIAEQLVRAVASVSANIGEGYGRSMPADRARFYDIALGSLRESASWYEAMRLHVSDDLVDTRLNQFAELRRMLYGALRALRQLPPGTRIA
jgi:four helix bundle protein